MSEHFKLGSEQILEIEHIGSVVMIDAFLRQGSSSTATLTRSKSYCGTLIGFTEDRGETHVAGDIGEVNFSSFPDYEVTIYLDGGRSVHIGERDAATVTIYKEG